jgi:membrane protein
MLQAKHFGIELPDLLRAAWIEYQRDRAEYLAVAMIYYAVVSLIPFLSLLLSVLGLLLRFSSAAAEVERNIMTNLEAKLGPQLPAMIEVFLKTLQQESIIGTIISLLGLFLTASVLFRQLRLSFRAIWKYEPPLVSGPLDVVVRTIIRERVISVAMVLGGAGLLVAALALIAAIQVIDRLMGGLTLTNYAAGWSLGAVSSFAVDVITFGLLSA